MWLQKSGLVLALVALSFAMASCKEARYLESQRSSADAANNSVLEASKGVLEAFSMRNGEKLAALVHPKKGVRFSSSAYVDVENDVVFSSAQAGQFWKDHKTYDWGFADGTGDVIQLTPSAYCERYILDQDFINSSSVNVNGDRASGNTGSNAALVYPQGMRVEYYIALVRGGKVPEFDWAALRLVFESVGGDWFLVAVIHDEWSP